MLATAAGNHFSLSEEIIASAARTELLLTPKEIERKLNGKHLIRLILMFIAFIVVIEDRLVEDPKQIVYDSLYFELKDLFR